jgi:hypothetical protein
MEKWDMPVNDIGEDSCVALYWSPRELAAGGRREIGFAIGLGTLNLEKKMIEKK